MPEIVEDPGRRRPCCFDFDKLSNHFHRKLRLVDVTLAARRTILKKAKSGMDLDVLENINNNNMVNKLRQAILDCVSMPAQ